MSQHWNYLSPIPPGPLSPSVVKACYQFDGPTLGLTDRSGNGHTLSMDPDNDGIAWTAMKAAYGCNAIVIAYAGNWLKTAAVSTLHTVGAATVEIVMMRYYLGSLDDTYNGYFGVGGSNNMCFSVYGTNTRNRLGVFHEVSGTNYSGESPGYWVVGLSGHLQYFAITRASDGKTYKLYIDGEYVEDIVLAAAPVVTSTATLYIASLQGVTTNSGGLAAFQSLRWSHAELSPAQIGETYLGLRTAA